MTLPDLSTHPHHHVLESITSIICDSVQNQDKPFFRSILAYHFMSVAATMRASLKTLDRGEIPVNGYVIALSPTGTGKGHSMSIMENEIFKGFRRTFMDLTLPQLAEKALYELLDERLLADPGKDEDALLAAIEKEYANTGAYVFQFDEAHPSAVKQIRDKLLMVKAGSVNLVVDEIGMNLRKIHETLPLFLELYDKGNARPKLYMNTNDRKRIAPYEGSTPTNMLLFGTPHMLLDGDTNEDIFYDLLESGYARRSIFAMGKPKPSHHDMTAEEIFDALCDSDRISELKDWSLLMEDLASLDYFNMKIDVPRDVGIALLTYRHHCEDIARRLPDQFTTQKAEISHRYFKALKLAGAYSFIDSDHTLSLDNLYSAIKLVEESGAAFDKILRREKPFAKLARYLAEIETEVTHADLIEALSFFKGSATARNDLLTNSIAWGYRHAIVISRKDVDGVEFLSGQALKDTDLSELIVSYSDDWSEGYMADLADIEIIEDMLTHPDLNWCNHTFEDEHRLIANAQPEFNMAVLDVDGGTRLEVVHELLSEYVFVTQTTKRHDLDDHRFRLIIPLSHHLKLDVEDYREFMDAICDWLPFSVDRQASKDIARKWLTHEHAIIHKNLDGELLDVMPFIPRTKRNEDRVKAVKSLGDLSSLERWFAQRMATGDRNNQLLKYAMVLVDAGKGYDDIEKAVLRLNDKITDKLPKDEILNTIMVTVARKL